MSGQHNGLVVGGRYRFFDYRPWLKAGGDCKTPGCFNDCHFLPGTVERLYSRPGYPSLADVRFDHDGQESRALFTDFVKPLRAQSQQREG